MLATSTLQIPSLNAIHPVTGTYEQCLAASSAGIEQEWFRCSAALLLTELVKVVACMAAQFAWSMCSNSLLIAHIYTYFHIYGAMGRRSMAVFRNLLMSSAPGASRLPGIMPRLDPNIIS